MKKPTQDAPWLAGDANYRRLAPKEASLIRLIGEATGRPQQWGVVRRKLLTVRGSRMTEVAVSRRIGLRDRAVTHLLTVHMWHSRWRLRSFVKLANELEVSLDVLWTCVLCLSSYYTTEARRAREQRDYRKPKGALYPIDL